MRPSRLIIALGLSMALSAPLTVEAAQGPARRNDGRCGEHSPCSDDHGRDGDREKCVGLIAFCGATITIPPGVFPGPGGGGQKPKITPACPPVMLPVVPHCDPAPARAESIFPPNPQRLAEAMATMAQKIGEAAGALAGAIVGGVGGVFLG